MSEWLAQFGLRENPFVLIDESMSLRDGEFDDIVSHPLFDVVLDDVQMPMSHHIVVSERGGGKTVLRNKLVYQCSVFPNILVVQMIDWPEIYHRVLVNENVSEKLAVSEICRCILSHIGFESSMFGELDYFLRFKRVMLECVNKGIDRICIIIDGLDEVVDSDSVQMKVADVVCAIIRSVWLHKIPCLSFKYMMNLGMFKKIQINYLPVKVVALDWSTDLLKRVIDLRIKNRSLYNDKVSSSLSSMAVPEIQDIESLIVDMALPRNTPRGVLMLCNRLLEIAAANASRSSVNEGDILFIEKTDFVQLVTERSRIFGLQKTDLEVEPGRYLYKDADFDGLENDIQKGKILNLDQTHQLQDVVIEVMYTKNVDISVIISPLPVDVIVSIRMTGVVNSDMLMLIDKLNNKMQRDRQGYYIEIVLKRLMYFARDTDFAKTIQYFQSIVRDCL